MGCSASAIADDAHDLERAMRKVGLHSDKKYGRIDIYTSEASVVKKCADAGMNKTDTIKALIEDKHLRAAAVEFKQEMEDRAPLERLSKEYGAR